MPGQRTPRLPPARGVGWGRRVLAALALARGGPSAAPGFAGAAACAPQAGPPGLLVPAYFYPHPDGSDWDVLADSATAWPGVRLTAIMNPSNGVFTAADPHYQRAAARFVAAGGCLLGYVHTRYGTGQRPLAQVQADVDAYLSLYGPDLVSGFFIDEMAAAPDGLPYYRALRNHIRRKGAGLQVVGNPGTVPDAAYADVADVLVVREGSGSSLCAPGPQAWHEAGPHAAGSWAVLLHGVRDCAAMQAAVQQTVQASPPLALLYATDRTFDPVLRTGNPWAGLPTYWPALLQTVDALRRGPPVPLR